MLGGTNVKMSGPCFTANDNIVVQLDNDVNINATFSDELTSSVTIPVLNKTGRLSFKLSTDGGNSFDYNGVYTSGTLSTKFFLLSFELTFDINQNCKFKEKLKIRNRNFIV